MGSSPIVVTPTYAQIQIKEGKQIGKKLAGFKQNIDKPLAAILTLNTIAHTVGAIGVGVQASSVWSGAHPLITTLIVPAIMTLAILLLSEIVPKPPWCYLLERISDLSPLTRSLH